MIEQNFIDLALALRNKSLAFLVGAGFSKYLTDGSAPTWLELLYACARQLENSTCTELFETENENPISCAINLHECAEILRLEYEGAGKSLQNEVINIISDKTKSKNLNANAVNTVMNFFEEHQHIDLLTTNFDLILAKDILPSSHVAIVNDSPIYKNADKGKIYHLHGTIDKKESMVISSQDYYNFTAKRSYFASKIYTLLHEKTTVILGYAMDDFNFSSILINYNSNKPESIRKSDLHVVFRKELPDHKRIYLKHFLNCQTIESTEIDEFFTKLSMAKVSVERTISSKPKLTEVIAENSTSWYSEDFLRLRGAFRLILAEASENGVNPLDGPFVSFLGKLLAEKWRLCLERNAWEQYKSLIFWLVEFGNNLPLQDHLRSIFIDYVRKSLTSCSKIKMEGKAWEAWRTWKNEYRNLNPIAKELIRESIEDLKEIQGQCLREIVESP